MGKTKTAIIDDSQPKTEDIKKEPRKKILAINSEEKPKKILGANREKEAAVKEEKQAEKKTETETKEEKKETPKQGKKYRSKKYQDSREKVNISDNYKISEAVEKVKESSYSKFDGTLEIHVSTKVKTLRGLVSLPFASGKKLKILAFGKGAEDSGADVVGNDGELSNLEKGKVNFDVIVTTAEWMPRLARLAKVLGPRGLMPNPKNGTITDDLKKAVTELQSGKVEYKTEKDAPVLHLGLGKLTQPNEELEQNIKVLLTSIGKTKIKKVVIAPTMGPGIKLDISSL